MPRNNIVNIPDTSNEQEFYLYENKEAISGLLFDGISHALIARKYGVSTDRLKRFLRENPDITNYETSSKIENIRRLKQAVLDDAQGIVRDDQGEIIKKERPNGKLAVEVLNKLETQNVDTTDIIMECMNFLQIHEPEMAIRFAELIKETSEIIQYYKSSTD